MMNQEDSEDSNIASREKEELHSRKVRFNVHGGEGIESTDEVAVKES
jgi:hypothetical protein